MTIFMLSLGGVPPTGGFFAKFYLFRAALESPQLYWLVVIGVLNSVVSVYYYLRVVVAMYFRDASRPLAPIESASMNAGLIITAIAVVLLGIFPGSIVEWAGPAPAAPAAWRSPRWSASRRAHRRGQRDLGRRGSREGREGPGGFDECDRARTCVSEMPGVAAVFVSLAALVFISLAATVAGCAKNPFPSSLTPKSCPGDPCGMMACPSGFVCSVDSQCGARCQAQPVGNRPF